MITAIRITLSLSPKAVFILAILRCCYTSYSQAQDIDVEAEAARQAVISAHGRGALTTSQPVSIQPAMAADTRWQKDARHDLAAEGHVVRSLGDPAYQKIKAKYTPHLVRSLPNIRSAWQDVKDKDAPDAWRCIVIEAVPTLLADPTVSVTGLVSELQAIIRNDSSLGVRSAAIVTSEAIILQGKSVAERSSIADKGVSSIVASVTAILHASGKASTQLTSEESTMLSISFQSLLRLIRHANVDKSKYRGSIEAWGENYLRFDYNACLNYIRLLKSGIGMEPTSGLYDHAKRVARSKSESRRIDFIRNVNLDADE